MNAEKDLDILSLFNYNAYRDILKSALKAGKDHFWYLSEINIGLALVIPEEKEMKC